MRECLRASAARGSDEEPDDDPRTGIASGSFINSSFGGLPLDCTDPSNWYLDKSFPIVVSSSTKL